MNVAKICYWTSESVDEIVAVINRSLFPKFDCEINLEKLKERIVYTLVNANSNKSRLKTITYRMLEGTDLAITYKLIIWCLKSRKNNWKYFRHFSGTYFINKHYIKIITHAIDSYWTSAIKESEENQCSSGLTASNPGGLIAKGMVGWPFPFFFLCLVTRRGTGDLRRNSFFIISMH